jgi:hypothetical protein
MCEYVNLLLSHLALLLLPHKFLQRLLRLLLLLLLLLLWPWL